MPREDASTIPIMYTEPKALPPRLAVAENARVAIGKIAESVTLARTNLDLEAEGPKSRPAFTEFVRGRILLASAFSLKRQRLSQIQHLKESQQVIQAESYKAESYYRSNYNHALFDFSLFPF